MNLNKEMTVDDEIAYNNYKLTADKILQLLSQIREDPSASSKRWVWELLQNAKDVPNKYGKVSVEIELVSPDILKFRHNGDSFSTKNITGLVQQVSSKDSQNHDGQTGKFGTGFICTHLLSDVIDVEGIVTYMGVNRKFQITLDRSGYRSEDLLPRIESTLEELRHIETAYQVVNNYEDNRTEQSFDTVFTYHLTTPEKRESAIAGLEDLVNTLPITLVTQSKKIKQVRVIDHVKGTNVVYTCDSSSLGDNVQLSTIKIDNIVKTYLSYITEDVALTTEVKATDGKWEVIKRDSKQPVLYRDFPLIGSEKFYFPYTLNGFDFNPTERRNGLLLNSADHPDCVSNRNIVDKAVDAVFKFNEWLIANNASNRYLLASSRIPESPERYSDSVAAPWIKNLQLNWRKRLLDQNLVETASGSNIVRNLSVPSFTSTSTKEINEAFYKLLENTYIGRGVLPKFEHLHGWLDVVRPEYEAWGTKLKYEKDDFLTDLSSLTTVSKLEEKISKNHEETLQWLNKVYKFLIEQNMLNELDNYAIIPNQKGDFKLLKELYSDHASRIPSKLKDIYNSVNLDNAPIQNILMDDGIEAAIFGNSLRSFCMKEMIDKLNEYAKSGTSIVKNNKIIDVRAKVAYDIISLYPSTQKEVVSPKRKTMYNFCTSYREMDVFTEINADLSLWNEADAYWFGSSWKNIENQKDVATFAKNFFLQEKSVDEALIWLNDYLKFFRENAYGDFIKEKCIFPRQLKNSQANGVYTFCKLEDLRYDNDVPEEFKSLGDIARDIAGRFDYCRQFLLHKSIKGYEDHNPFSIKDLYAYVKNRFDEGNDEIKEAIARRAISIMVKQENSDPEEKKLYDFASIISDHDFIDPEYVEVHTGFSWGFAQEYYIKYICNRIVEAANLSEFKKLNSCLIEKNDQELIHWIDSLIEFLNKYKDKKFWPIITDKEKGYGIWVNQNNDFCRFQDVRKDNGISSDLLDIAKDNCHVNHDFREELFTLDSAYSNYLETVPMDLTEVAKFIDDKLKEYDGNKQDKDFRALVFDLGKLCKEVKGLEDEMEYFKETRNSLIVWSLGEGTTMDLVGSIVQQGDDKLRAVKEILEGHSFEDLENISSILHDYKGDKLDAEKLDKVKELINKLNSDDSTENPNNETPMGGDDQFDFGVVPRTYDIDVEDGNGNKLTITVNQVQYAGLSLEEIERYVEEAKYAVVKRFKDLDEKNNLGLHFDNERICKKSFSQLYGITDKDGKDIPLVVHSYKGPQFRYFNLNWYDWQVLSRPGSMLWVLTVSGLQCIPLYALPVRNFNFSINRDLSEGSRTALLTLAQVGKKYDICNNITFDFGNNMPHGFTKPLYFNEVPNELKESVNDIKEVCDSKLPLLANVYNTAKNIHIVENLPQGYSQALKDLDEQTQREIFESEPNDMQPPVAGTAFID